MRHRTFNLHQINLSVLSTAPLGGLARAYALDVPVELHAQDRQWVCRPAPALLKGNSLDLDVSVTLVRCGGHFSGGRVLCWQAGSGGTGALLTGDSIDVVMDRRWVGFMHSFSNPIPFGAPSVRRLVSATAPS